MKISILTATYNRAKLLSQLYNSLKENLKCKIDFEWLIMDDGSTDETKETVKKFIDEKLIDVKYFYQENQGKMAAINNLVPKLNVILMIFLQKMHLKLLMRNMKKIRMKKIYMQFAF